MSPCAQCGCVQWCQQPSDPNEGPGHVCTLGDTRALGRTCGPRRGAAVVSVRHWGSGGSGDRASRGLPGRRGSAWRPHPRHLQRPRGAVPTHAGSTKPAVQRRKPRSEVTCDLGTWAQSAGGGCTRRRPRSPSPGEPALRCAPGEAWAPPTGLSGGNPLRLPAQAAGRQDPRGPPASPLPARLPACPGSPAATPWGVQAPGRASRDEAGACGEF